MIVKILGGGCPKCKQLADNTQKAADELGIEIIIEKITDFKQYADYGVMVTPALIIDEKLISSGKVLNPDQIKPYIK